MESCLKQLEVPEMPPDRTGSEPMATRFPLGLRPREREGAVGGPATLGTGPRREGRNRSSRGGDRAELKEADVPKARQPWI